MLKVLNSQLIAMLMWLAPMQILTQAHSENLLPVLLKELTSYENKYEETHERSRVILGLNSLLALPQKPPEIMFKMPDIFKMNLKLIRKNAEERVDGEDNDKWEDDGFDAENEEENLQFESDDEDFWE